MEEEHPDETVAGLVELEKVDDSVDRRREGTVEPTPALADQLGSRLRHVRLGLTGLDVGERPPVVGLRDKLETEDTILRQEHVLREDVHAVDTLGTEAVGKRVVTVEVLLQGLAQDSAESVGREGTGKHGHVAEATLQRFVCATR